MPSEAKQSDNARAVIHHLCEKLGLSVSAFAEGAGVSDARLQGFLDGAIQGLDDSEVLALHNTILPLANAEEDEAEYYKKMLQPAPRTCRDVVKDRMAAK
jgi:hypothetical protein